MKVVRVKFKDTNKEYYFSSYVAIYEQFTPAHIGAVVGSIWNVVSKKGFYENNKVVIESFDIKNKKRKSK